MRRFVKLFTVALFFTVFLCAAQAQADPLIVTSGSVSMTRAPNGFLQPITFLFQGQNFQIQGLADVFTSPNPATGGDLGPGTTISLSSVLSEFAGGSSFMAVVNGTTYGGSQIGIVGGNISLASGSFTLPVDGTPSLTVTDSFQMSGLLVAYPAGNSVNPVLSTQLSGLGQVTLNLILQSNGLYSVQGFTYEFRSNNAPVPEPATIILLGTGLFGLVARARARAGKTKEHS